MDKRNSKDLIVWQKASSLVPRIYAVIGRLPPEERYAIGDQLRRSSVSIAANIAEGQARRHRKEFLQHLSIAKASLAELHTLLIVARRLNYLDDESLTGLEREIGDLARPLHRLMASLQYERTDTNHQPPTTNAPNA